MRAEFQDVTSANFTFKENQTPDETIINERWRVLASAGEKGCDLQPIAITNQATAPGSKLGLPVPGQPYVDGRVGGNPNKAHNLCDDSYSNTFVRSYSWGALGTDENGTCYRELTVNYSQRDPTEKNNERDERPPGETSDDPDQWQPKAQSSSVERLRSLEFQKFKGLWEATDIDCQNNQPSVPSLRPINNQCTQVVIGECTRPQNTAGEPFTSYPELEDTDWVHRLTVYRKLDGNVESIDQWREYVRSVNSTRQTYDIGSIDWRITLPIGTGRLRSVTLDTRTHTYNDSNGAKKQVKFREAIFEIVDRAEGWDVDLVNAGFQRCAAPGVADGQGGTHDGSSTSCPDGSPGCSQGAEQHEGGTPTTMIRDKNGNPPSQPELLDDQGQPLRTNNDVVNPNIRPLYSRWAGRTETDWDQCPMLNTLKTSVNQPVELGPNAVTQVSVSALGGTSGTTPTTLTTWIADVIYLRGTLSLTGADAFELRGDQLWLKAGQLLTAGTPLNVTVNRSDPPNADSKGHTVSVIA